MFARRQAVFLLIIALLLIDLLGALWLWSLWPRRPSQLATGVTPRTAIPARRAADPPPPKPRPAPKIPSPDR